MSVRSLPASVVDCAVYVDGERLPGRWTPAEAVAEVRDRGAGFVWLGLREPTAEEMRDVAAAFGLHPRTVRDVGRSYQRPKLERRDDAVFMVLKTVCHVPHESSTTAHEIVETGEVVVFLGAAFIVTVRRGEHSGLHGVRRALEAAPERLGQGPIAVLHAIAGHVVDSYFDVTRAFAADIDEIEAVVFAPRSTIGAEQMYLMKREIVELHRSVGPLVALLRGAAELVPEEARSEFDELDDRLADVADQVAEFDRQLTSLLHAALAKVALRQNHDTRMITAWAAIIAVPTLGAGVYGMNFEHLPELHWEYGRPVALAVIAVGCLVLHRMFKRNSWL